MSDNSTAYINKERGTQSTTCNQLTKDIWVLCIDKGTRVSAAHIPGKQNILADIASRKFHDASEWMLNKISLESTKALVIALMWPTQSWFNKLLELAVEQPMIIKSKYLQLPGTNKKYLRYPKLRLLAVMFTQNQHKQAQFSKKQSMSSMQRGEMERKTNINTYSKEGKNFIVKGTTIQCRLIQM